MLPQAFFIISLLFAIKVPALAGDRVSGKGQSDLFVSLKEKALSDARYWAREEARSNCEKLGGTPSLSTSATTYSEGVCQPHPKNLKLMRCHVTAQILCSGLSAGTDRALSCPDGRKVFYQRRLVKSWSNQRLLVFESDHFSQTMKLTGDEYSELIALEKSREPQKKSPVFRKVQEALCAVSQQPGSSKN